MFHQGFQTPRNNKSTRPTASCLHYFLGVCSLQNRRDFLRISGEQRRKRGESEAKARRARGERELRARGGALKNPACPHTIVQAVPAFKYERGYLIGYFETRDPRMFFQDVTQSRTVI